MPLPVYIVQTSSACHTRVKYYKITLFLYANVPVWRLGTISLSFSNNALIWCSFGSHPIPIWLYFSFHLAFIDLRVARIWRAHGAHLTRAWLTHGSHLAHIWLALARTRLALSSRLNTDFIIWPIVTVLYYVLCSVCVLCPLAYLYFWFLAAQRAERGELVLLVKKKSSYQSFCSSTLVQFHSHKVFRDIIQSLVPKWAKIHICGYLGFT